MFNEGDKVIILSQGGGHLIRHHLAVGTIATVDRKPYKNKEVYVIDGLDDEGDTIRQTVSLACIMKWDATNTTNQDVIHLLRSDSYV